MSRENVDVVRQPLRVRPGARRSWEGWIAVGFPRIAAFLWLTPNRVWRSLPPGSWLRRAMSRRYLRLGFEAYNRDDLQVATMGFAPDGESIYGPGLVSIGSFDPVVRGPEARRNAHRRWRAEWGDFRFEPEEVIDLADDRVLVVGRLAGIGSSSGATVDSDWALLLTFRGLLIREEAYLDRREALEAVGLRE